jgi:hypothetical protein
LAVKKKSQENRGKKFKKAPEITQVNPCRKSSRQRSSLKAVVFISLIAENR